MPLIIKYQSVKFVFMQDLQDKTYFIDEQSWWSFKTSSNN